MAVTALWPQVEAWIHSWWITPLIAHIGEILRLFGPQ